VPGKELIEDHAQGIHVAGRGHALAADLLGAGVIGGHETDDGCRFICSLYPELGREQLGDPEVQELRVARRRDQDVGGLEVTVHDEALVRVLHRIADSKKELKARRDREPAPVAVGEQVLPVHILHYEVGEPFVGRPSVVEARDAGVLQSGQDLPLRAEAAHDERRVHSTSHYLDRHRLA
jgi:hypothetical protein